MDDLISRQDAIDALGERPMVWTDDDQYALGERNQYDRDRLAIGTLPSAQPERKKGQWIYNESDDMFECSVCGGEMIRNVFTYCPWCGVRMVKGDEMTSKEAAEYIREHLVGDDTKWDKAMHLAYCALQKQIPKKALQACGHATERWMNYCPICGQRIDWEGDEG